MILLFELHCIYNQNKRNFLLSRQNEIKVLYFERAHKIDRLCVEIPAVNNLTFFKSKSEISDNGKQLFSNLARTISTDGAHFLSEI